MITIILAIIVTIVLAYIINSLVVEEWNVKYWEVDEWLCSILSIVVSLIITIFPFGNIIYSNRTYINPIEYHETWELGQIRTTDYANTSGQIRGGRFYVLGSITTNSDTAYKVYRKMNDTDFKLETIPSTQSIIRYNDKISVEKTYYACPETHLTLFGTEWCDTPQPTYIINVPDGSIINKIEL